MANEKITGQTAVTEVLRLIKIKDSDLESLINSNTTAIGNLTGTLSSLQSRVTTDESNISANTTNIANNSSEITTINNTIPTLSLKSETGYKLNLELDTTNYILVAKLYNKDNTLISTSDEINLPIESMIVDARYDAVNKDLIFTLDNGTELTVPLDDIVSGLATQADLDILTGRVTTDENNIQTNTTAIGNLQNLNTSIKTSLVAAINEVDAHADSNSTIIQSHTTSIQNNTTAIQTNTNAIGDLSQLETQVTTDLVSAINDLKTSAEVTYSIGTSYNTSTNVLTTTLTDSTGMSTSSTANLSDLEEVEIGPTQPTDSNIKVWVDTSNSQVPYTLNYPNLSNLPKLNTLNTTSQTTDDDETITGTINLHKISKTGSYTDLLNTPELITTSEINNLFT